MQPTTLLPPSFVFALEALNTAIGELLVDLNQPTNEKFAATTASAGVTDIKAHGLDW